MKKELIENIPKTLEEALHWSGDYFHIAQAIDYHHLKKTESFLIEGYLLCLAQKQKLWLHDGSCARNFFHWCENERHISRSSAQRMILVFSVFSQYLNQMGNLILNIDFTKLALIAPSVGQMTNQDDVIEMLHSAENNTYRALRCNLAEREGRTPQDLCIHEETKTITVCKKCGKVLSVLDLTNGKT